MKKTFVSVAIVWMMLSLLLFGMVSGCGHMTPAGENTADASESKTSKASEPEMSQSPEPGFGDYEVKETVYSNDGVNVKYPQITGLKDVARQEAINGMIRQRALAPYEEAVAVLLEDQTYEADATYEIRLKTVKLLSISYNSYNYYTPSAHPYSMFHTTNIDMETGKERLLADIVPVVDERFADAVKKGKYMGEFDKEAEAQIRIQAFGLDMGEGELLKMLKGEYGPLGICVYLTADSLGLSLSVAHVAGDHVEFEIGAGELEKLGIRLW
jgi:hypothetical protein